MGCWAVAGCREQGLLRCRSFSAAACLQTAAGQCGMVLEQRHCKRPQDQHAADGLGHLELASTPAMALLGNRLRTHSVLVRASQASPNLFELQHQVALQGEAVAKCDMASCWPVLPLTRISGSKRAAGSLPCSRQRTDMGPWCPGRSSATC